MVLASGFSGIEKHLVNDLKRSACQTNQHVGSIMLHNMRNLMAHDSRNVLNVKSILISAPRP